MYHADRENTIMSSDHSVAIRCRAGRPLANGIARSCIVYGAFIAYLSDISPIIMCVLITVTAILYKRLFSSSQQDLLSSIASKLHAATDYPVVEG